MKISLPQDTPHGQSDAITAKDKTITVEAGAGTGKTWVLSQRYLRLLLDDDDLLPSDILTLTYTEATADEMKSRIGKLISDSLDYFPGNERRQHILDGLSDSWISTIHAFSTKLIRESGLSLDIDPMASVISAYQEQSFWEDIRNAAEFAGIWRLARNYAGSDILRTAESLDHDKYMSAAVGKWGAGTLADFARKNAELHASSGLSWADMLKWADDDSGLIAEAGLKVMASLRGEWSKAWDLWKDIHISGVKKNDAAGNALMVFLDGMRANPPADDGMLLNFYSNITGNPGFIGKTTPLLAIRDTLVGDTLSEWRKKQPVSVKNIAATFLLPISPEEARMRKTLLKFCAVSWGLWDIMKSKRGLLSFSDMILHAKRTIEQKGIRRAFKHILVDEFQDTDPLQFSMIESLKNYSTDSGLFAVGDPKQSIYKFRHADPELFADLIKHNDTRRIHLDTSFRTRDNLLSRINDMFSHLWPDGISRQDSMRDVKYNALSPVRDVERESGTMPEFRVYLLRNYGGVDNSRKIMASHIAAKISSWVNEGRTVWDKRDKVIRPAKFSDFAILTRGRGSFSVLEEALERCGIPSVQDRSNDYFSRGEIGDVVCTLRAAANMADDFSVMGWLMSPFSGVEEADAVTECLALADDEHKPIDLMRENLPGAYSRLEYLSVVGENEGASGILSYYDRNREWLSCYPEKDRLRVLRNVRLALRIAREFESSGTSSLVSCAEYMTHSIRAKSSYEEPAWHDDSEDAVRLGAVHSAKGLEYPVTIVFEDRTRRNSDKSSVKPSRELGLVFSKLPDEMMPPDGFTPKLSEWHKLLSQQGDSEEEERLFYVACTRAQDSLIFCGLINPIDKKTLDPAPKGYRGTWSEFMLKSIDGMNDVTPEIIADGGDIVPSSGHDDTENVTVQVQTVKADRALRQISATSFSLYEWCPYAWRRKYRQGRTLTWELPDRGGEQDDDVHGGAALGSLAHWILARWPKTEDYGTELDTLLYDRDTLGRLPGYLRDTWRNCDKDTLREWLMRFAESPLGVELRNTPGVTREKTFRLPLTADTVMAGSVDAVYGDCVVDHKITAKDDMPEEFYAPQLDFYALAVREMKKSDSVKAIISFLRENMTQERVITDFASIRERIERAASECASGKNESYPANHTHCGKCPFRKGCVKDAGRREE